MSAPPPHAKWYKPYLYALGLFGLSLGAFFITRLVFIITNLNYLGSPTALDIVKALLWGTRFDLGIVFYCTLLPLLLAHLPFEPPQWLFKGAYATWLCCTTLCVWANVFDIAYFPFSKRRSSLSILAFAFDAQNQLGQLLVQYWFSFLCNGLTPVALLWLSGFYRRAGMKHTYPRSKHAPWLLLVSAPLGTLFIRGGVQRKPLTTAHASALGNPMMAYAILNTPFVMIHTNPRSQLTPLTHFSTWNDVVPSLLGPLMPTPEIPLPPRPQDPQNVVVIIAESYCNEFSSVFNPGAPSYTPFLDQLAQEGLAFSNHFANGTRSIEAISSVLAGIVSLMDEPFISSPYHTVDLQALPHALSKTHTSHFYHGGKNGTFYFDIFAKIAGFQHYIGLNEYPDKKDFDGSWGIFDEPFLQFVARDLTQIQSSSHRPFFASIFTLSAHNPYTIPSQYTGQFPKGTLAIHESMAYADHALKLFFQTASKQPWFANTLFVITGDHTSLSQDPRFQTTVGRYRVPLVLFHPRIPFGPKLHPRICHHADILPTILHWMGVEPSKKSLFGRSVFSQEEGVAFNQNGGHSWIMNKDVLVEITPTGAVAATALNSQETSLQTTELLETRLKAFLQYFHNGLIENRLLISPALSPLPKTPFPPTQ